jgi:diguanylate cyclase (GGDEF)-like protein/PAS domain S-box-containing protein
VADELDQCAEAPAIKPVRWPYFAALFVFLAVLLGGAFAEHRYNSVRQKLQRGDVGRELNMIRARIEGDVKANIQLVRGLIAVITADSDMDQTRFAAISSGLFTTKTHLRSVFAAPDLVVSLSYPVHRNQDLIGLDFRSDPVKTLEAWRVQERGDVILAGPLELLDGGTGLIVRYPVYVRDPDRGRRFWGLVSAVVDIQRIFFDSGLLDRDLEIDVAIRGRDGMGSVGEQFFGAPAVFDRDPVVRTVTVPGGSWQMAATQKGGWHSAVPEEETWLLRGAVLVAAVLLALPLLNAGRLINERQRYTETLRRREQKLHQLSTRLALALDTSEIGIWEVDVETASLDWDERTRDMYGIRRDQAMIHAEDWIGRLHPDMREEADARFRDALARNGRYENSFRIVLPDGSERVIRAIGACHRDAKGRQRVIGVNWDVTADVELNERLSHAKRLAEDRAAALETARRQMEHNAFHDALTDLPNRRYLDRILEAGGPRPEAGADCLALMQLDLDRFKAINDTMGHACGDLMLKHVADVLRRCTEPGDFVARIGGDEFVIALQRPLEDSALAAIAEDLIAEMKKPVTIEGVECRIGISIGISSARCGGVEPQQLIVNADIALYRAKAAGRAAHAFYERSVHAEVVRTKTVEDELLVAIDRDEFEVWFQPQFNARTHQICGVEALARWEHPVRGTIAPAGFLKTAEALNLLTTIDERIMRKALTQSSRWLARGHRIPQLSVNVSAHRLRDPRLLDTLRALEIPDGFLSFELLESSFLDDLDPITTETIAEISKLGIRIEIDDFGSGHASFVSFLKLRPHRLKIDRQLVMSLTESREQREMVASIINIARTMNAEVLAEGVETMEHARILADLGCDALQGYAFARPMSSESFLAYLDGANEKQVLSA